MSSNKILPTIVIHIQEIGLRDQIDPIIERLGKSGLCNLIVVIFHEQLEKYVNESAFGELKNTVFANEEQFVNSKILPQVILSLHPETPSNLAKIYDHPEVARICMQHGLTDKSAFFHEESGIPDPLFCYDGLFLSGPVFLTGSMIEYKKRNPDTFERLEIFGIGSPKTDALFINDNSSEDFYNKYNINRNKPVVTYAPTYEKNASLTQYGHEIIEALAKIDANILIKLHHVSLKDPEKEPWVLEHTKGINWKNEIEHFQETYPNIKLIKEQNANQTLKATDVLVSDVSGISYEYLLQNKPIVFYDVPKIFEEHGKEGIHYWGRKSGEIARTPLELKNLVEDALANPGKKCAEREDVINAVAFNVGNAAQVACDTLLEISNGILAGMNQ